MSYRDSISRLCCCLFVVGYLFAAPVADASGERGPARVVQKKQRAKRQPLYLRGHVHIPHGYVIEAAGTQPAMLFDKKDNRLAGLYKGIAALKGQHPEDAWKVLRGVESLIKKQMKHAGNEIDVRRNNNAYTRFIDAIGNETPALSKVGDYWSFGEGVCREIAAITQVGADAAGFPTVFYRGMLTHRTQGDIGRHDIVGVRVKDKWFALDSVNPMFTGVELEAFMNEGVKGGYKFRKDSEGKGAVLHRRWLKDRKRERERPWLF